MTSERIQEEKRHKFTQIKKILKERLNIDSLRMLGEDHPDKATSDKKQDQSAAGQDLLVDDSYHELMREIGAGDNDGLS